MKLRLFIPLYSGNHRWSVADPSMYDCSSYRQTTQDILDRIDLALTRTRKPWQRAKPGEQWRLKIGSYWNTYMVINIAGERVFYTLTPWAWLPKQNPLLDSPQIVAGYRIQP